MNPEHEFLEQGSRARPSHAEGHSSLRLSPPWVATVSASPGVCDMSPKSRPCLMHAGTSTEAQEQGAEEMEHVGRPWRKATRPQVVSAQLAGLRQLRQPWPSRGGPSLFLMSPAPSHSPQQAGPSSVAPRPRKRQKMRVCRGQALWGAVLGGQPGDQAIVSLDAQHFDSHIW